MNNFSRAKGLGKWAERIVIAHLEKKGLRVLDVSEDEVYQKIGVDIIVEEFGPADVKLDRMISRTGNLFIETMSGENVMGNMVTSMASVFFYLDSGDCRLYSVDRLKVMDYWLANQETLTTKQVRNPHRVTKGFLIKKDDIIKLGLGTVEDIYIDGARNCRVECPA